MANAGQLSRQQEKQTDSKTDRETVRQTDSQLPRQFVEGIVCGDSFLKQALNLPHAAVSRLPASCTSVGGTRSKKLRKEAGAGTGAGGRGSSSGMWHKS